MFELEIIPLFELPNQAKIEASRGVPIICWSEEDEHFVGYIYQESEVSFPVVYRFRVPLLISYTNMVADKTFDTATFTALAHFLTSTEYFLDTLPEKISFFMLNLVKELETIPDLELEFKQGFEVAWMATSWYEIFDKMVYPFFVGQGAFSEGQRPTKMIIIEDDVALMAVFNFGLQEDLFVNRVDTEADPDFKLELSTIFGHLLSGSLFQDYLRLEMRWIVNHENNQGLLIRFSQVDLDLDDYQDDQEEDNEEIDSSFWIDSLEGDDSGIDWSDLFGNDK